MSRPRTAAGNAGVKLLQQRKQAIAKNKRATKQTDRLAGMSPRSVATLKAREAVKAAAKERRTTEGRAALRKAQYEYRQQLDEVGRHNEKKRAERRKQAVEQVVPKDDTTTPNRPPERRRVSFTPSTANAGRPRIAPEAPSEDATCPRVSELKEGRGVYRCDPVGLPSMDGLACMATASVVYADPGTGIGAWGEAAGTWAAPQRWIPLIERLNRAFKSTLQQAGESKKSQDLNMKLQNGEYNMVFHVEPGEEPGVQLPPLVDADGRVLKPEEVVFRATRPDAAVRNNGDPFHRYKSLEAISREFYYTLHGAAHGYAPPCLAAILYPGVEITYDDGTTETLYGALYVLQRAAKDLVSLMDDETRRLRDLHAGNTQSAAFAEAMRRSGRKAALWLLPVLVRQAKLGALSFDAKPANYVFGADGKPYAIDFDAAMYTVCDDTRAQWHAALLMIIALLTAHVRVYLEPAISDGWANVLRPLVLELCGHARSARWLFDARAVKRNFRESMENTDDASKRRLEMMTHAYFTSAQPSRGAQFKPQTGKDAPGLAEQLLKFSLHGTTNKRDNELSAALGCARAHSALAAAETVARPWG